MRIDGPIAALHNEKPQSQPITLEDRRPLAELRRSLGCPLWSDYLQQCESCHARCIRLYTMPEFAFLARVKRYFGGAAKGEWSEPKCMLFTGHSCAGIVTRGVFSSYLPPSPMANPQPTESMPTPPPPGPGLVLPAIGEHARVQSGGNASIHN